MDKSPENQDYDYKTAAFIRFMADNLGFSEEEAKEICDNLDEQEERYAYEENHPDEARHLDMGPDEQHRTKVAEFHGIVRRQPETLYGLPSPDFYDEIKNEKLPEAKEQKFAYLLYRSADLDSYSSYVFATQGFLFDEFTGAYIPTGIAKSITDDAHENDFDLPNLFSYMSSSFYPDDLPEDVLSQGKKAEFKDASFIAGLPVTTRREIWKSYQDEAHANIVQFSEET